MNMDVTLLLRIIFIGIIYSSLFSLCIIGKPTSSIEEFTSHEVVTPKLFVLEKLVTSTLQENGHVENLNVVLSLQKSDLILELHLNKNLFPTSYIEKYYEPGGKEIVITPSGHNTTKHCYYHGNIKDQPESVAAVSTCKGIRGMIVGKDEVFHIEPQESVINGRHLIFKDSEQVMTNHKCSSEDRHPEMPKKMSSLLFPKKHKRLKRSLYWPYDSDKDTKIVELYVANDNKQFRNQGSSVDKVITRTKEIINVASSLYKKVNTHLALIGIEIWTERDPIEIVENADTTMNNFLEYRRFNINPKHKNDNAQLITGHTFGQGVIGKAPINTICSWQYSGGVNMDHSNLVGPVATTVAHEMGHNFGLSHDLDSCSCPGTKCIMNSNSGGSQPHYWSSCSLEQFSDSFHQGMDYCLRDLPEALYAPPVCGNGFLETGEECDCGTPESCDSKCCNATTCLLFSNATCATGKCCNLETCQFKLIATECRSAVDSCDLPEYCHGNSEKCPSDTYRSDGQECTTSTSSGDSYCYLGRCRNRESQCQKLWGETGHESHNQCYTHFNVMGVANGNCGFNWVDKTFQKCSAQDSMCGMLHCEHRNEKLQFWKEALSYTMPEGWLTVNGVRIDCYGAILDVGLDYEDPGMVPNGAKCGDRKLCVDQKCTSIDDLPLLTCPDCHDRGVCNHYGQCHCDDGYAPPDCKHVGNGGSLHGGSSKIMKGNVGLAVGMAFLFIIILAAVIVFLVLGYRNRQRLKEKWVNRTTSDKYRSICRAQPNHAVDQYPIKPQRAAPAPPLHKKLSFNKPKHPPHPPQQEIKRTPSFRPEDITNLKLESTTNKCVESLAPLPARLRSPTLEAARAGGVGGIPDVHFHRNNGAVDVRPPPSRPAPTAPVNVGAHGDPGLDSPPGRPPPPKRYLSKNRYPTHVPNVSGNIPFISEDCYQNVQQAVDDDQQFDDINLNSPIEKEAHYEPTQGPIRPPFPTKKTTTPTDSSHKIGIADIKSRFETNNSKNEPVGKKAAGRSYPYDKSNVNNKPSGIVNKKTVPGGKPSLPSKPGVARTQSATGTGNAVSTRKPPLKAKPSLNLTDKAGSDSKC